MTTGLLTPTSKGISNYLASINKFPILSGKEEYMLAKRWQTKGDAKAARKLIISYYGSKVWTKLQPLCNH